MHAGRTAFPSEIHKLNSRDRLHQRSKPFQKRPPTLGTRQKSWIRVVTFFVQLSNQAPGDALKRGSGTQKLAQGHLDAMLDMDLALQKRIEGSQSAETETPKMDSKEHLQHRSVWGMLNLTMLESKIVEDC